MLLTPSPELVVKPSMSGSKQSSAGGDGTAAGLEQIQGEGYHVEILRDSSRGGTGYTVYGALVESLLNATDERVAHCAPGGGAAWVRVGVRVLWTLALCGRGCRQSLS